MRTLQVTRDNDLTVGDDGQLAMFSGLDALGQTSVQFVKARRGEMIHNADNGIPYDLVTWMGEPNEVQFEAAVRDTLRQVPNVVSVSAFEVVQVEDNLTYTATLQSTLGEVTVSG